MSGTQADGTARDVTEPVITILPVAMADELRRRAKDAERSLSAEVRLALRAHLSREA